MNNEEKINAGVKTISILTIIGDSLSIIFMLFALIFGGSLSFFLGSDFPIMETTIVLLMSIASLVFCILILLRKPMGVYGYFAIEILSFLNSLISNGLSFSLIIGLILPILMYVFIKKQNYLFNVKLP